MLTPSYHKLHNCPNDGQDQRQWDYLGGLFSLLDMVRFEGEKLYKVAQFLTELETILSTFTPIEGAEDIQPDIRELQLGRLRDYRTVLQVSGLSCKPVDRTIVLLEQSFPLPTRTLEVSFREILNRMHDDLGEINLWRVEQPLIIAQGKFFGLEVMFCGAYRDATEASMCLAFDRHTAGVFHLMRVMEAGLRKLGESLNDPTINPERNPSWEAILRRGDKELAKHYEDRSPEWRTDPQFFNTAMANLRAVKDAWRNPTLHVDHDYDGQEAREVWNAVRAFMHHLRTKFCPN
jgi:hypothetical protein